MKKPVKLLICVLPALVISLLAGAAHAAEGVNDSAQREGMIFIKAGCFEMGCGSWTSSCLREEKPVHEVCLDDFHMDVTEVTQRAYREQTGKNPSSFRDCDECPVESVTWHNAIEYCKEAGKRLPTEAEWEYAARSGGNKEKYAGTSGSPDAYAWYGKNSGEKTHSVGQKQPNGLGLYDMSGNVWEWVADWHDARYYKKSPRNNPKGPSSGKNRMLRGGSWYYYSDLVRTSVRHGVNPYTRGINIGFRCAGTP